MDVLYKLMGNSQRLKRASRGRSEAHSCIQVKAMEYFKKELSSTDINKRLAVPTRFFQLIRPRFKGNHFLDLKVKYKNQKMVLRCCRRKEGTHPKPVLTKGWVEFVRREKLKAGDRIVLEEEDEATAGVEFRIEVQKMPFRLFGKDI